MVDWKEKVTSVTDKVFPGIAYKVDVLYKGNEVASSLPLQMTLYFNVIFTPVWCVILLIFLDEQFSSFSELYKFITATVIFIVLVTEILRLYLGYEGNLRDKIPELAGFWMLSVVIQFPLQTFLLLNPYFELTVTEVCTQTCMFMLLSSQLIFGYKALKYTAAQQATYFRIMKLRGNLTMSDIQDSYKVK